MLSSTSSTSMLRCQVYQYISWGGAISTISAGGGGGGDNLLALGGGGQSISVGGGGGAISIRAM